MSKLLETFIPRAQLATLNELIATSEEREHFMGIAKKLENTIKSMPATYETEEVNDPLVQLHYFYGSADWWVVEKDIKPEQEQAFGYVNLGDDINAEMGYINILELVTSKHNIELDYYWTAIPVSQVMNRSTANDY